MNSTCESEKELFQESQEKSLEKFCKKFLETQVELFEEMQ